MRHKVTRIIGWALFGIAIIMLSSIPINILQGSYMSGGPIYTIVSVIVLAGMLIGGWKLAHTKQMEIRTKS